MFLKRTGIPTAEGFRLALEDIFITAGGDYVDVNAGDLHRAVGGYPGKNHRMPTCCEVMYGYMKPGDEKLLSPPKGMGAGLTVRYLLPR